MSKSRPQTANRSSVRQMIFGKKHHNPLMIRNNRKITKARKATHQIDITGKLIRHIP